MFWIVDEAHQRFALRSLPVVRDVNDEFFSDLPVI